MLMENGMMNPSQAYCGNNPKGKEEDKFWKIRQKNI